MARALEEIDRANGDDPTAWNGEPLARAQGRLAHLWVRRLEPDAGSALQLACRAHHLRRWVVPRSTYPDGRAGYLRWRRDQKTRHARELREILETSGLDPAVVDRATTIVAKIGLGTDPEVQAFEDAVCLTFVQTQLGSTAERLETEHLVEVVAKTLAKMSDPGRSALLTIDLDVHNQAIAARALERFAATHHR